MCVSAEKDFIASGRWYPLVIYYYPVFYYLGHGAYKALIIVFVVLNICLFSYFVRVVTFSDSAALAAAILPPLFLQVRQYHDPILSYYFLMQIELMLLMISLIFFARYLNSSKKFDLTVSILGYLMCVLTYEASYAFWIMYVITAYVYLGKSSPGRIVRASLPFFFTAVVNVGISLVVRHKYGTHYDGVALNLAAAAWAAAFLKQLFAAVPLSYCLTRGAGNFFDYACTGWWKPVIGICAGWLILWCAVLYSSRGTSTRPKVNPHKPLVLLGLGLWVLPATIVPFSAKYQEELRWGLGYLPVYLSVFGLMMLAVFAVDALCRAAEKIGPRLKIMVMAVTALVGAAMCGITYEGNRLVIQQYNEAEHYPRDLIEQALGHGLIRDVPNGSYLICAQPLRSWDGPAFYRMHSGLTLQVVRPAGFEPDVQLGNRHLEEALAGYRIPGVPTCYDLRRNNGPEPIFLGYEAQYKGIGWPVLVPKVGPKMPGELREAYVLKYEMQREGPGYAVVGRAIAMKADDKTVFAASCDRICVYVADARGRPWDQIRVTGSWMDSATLKTAGSFRFCEQNLRLISAGGQARVYDLPLLTGQYADPTSIVVTVVRGGED